MRIALRFLPALAVMAVLAAFSFAGTSTTAATGAAPARPSRLRPDAQPPLPPPPVREPRLPRPPRRARVAPHVARLFAEVTAPQEISLSPAVVVANIGFAGLLTGVLAYAGRLISPLERGLSAGARRLLRRDLLAPRAFPVRHRRAAAFVLLLMALSAMLRSFLSSPSGPFGAGGLFVVVTLFASAALLGGVSELARSLIARRHGLPASIEVKPTGALVATVTVAVSRVAGIVPGLMLGGSGGATYATTGTATAGVLTLTGVLAAAAVGAAAWMISYVVPQVRPDGWVAAHAQDFALGIYLSAVQGLIFGLLPAGGTPGETLWRWRRGVWLALAIPAAFLLFHTMLNPAGSFLDATRSVNAPVYVVLAGLLCALPAIPARGGDVKEKDRKVDRLPLAGPQRARR